MFEYVFTSSLRKADDLDSLVSISLNDRNVESEEVRKAVDQSER